MSNRRVVATGEVLKTSLNAETLQGEWGVTPEPGMLYVSVRAISSRVNANHDGWPAEELEKSYKSFVGRGVYVEHNNWDPTRSRGVILGVKLHKAHLANGTKDYWIELLEEIDAKSFPKLAEAILSGKLKSVSMGADVGFTVCSICSHKATEPSEYCEHIAFSKGMYLVTGGKKKLVWEDCYKVGFFEISHVFDPADESADVLGKYLHESKAASSCIIRERAESLDGYYSRLQRVASKSSSEEMRLPEDVDTLRNESEEIDEASPSEMSDPDVSVDKEIIDKFKKYIEKVEKELDEAEESNDMADDKSEESEDAGDDEEEEGEFDPNSTEDSDEDEDSTDEEDSEDDEDEEDEDMSFESSRIAQIRRKSGDLAVELDNQTTMVTDGEYEDASEMAPAASSVGPTSADTIIPDAVEDVEELDSSAVSGEPGQSEVSARRARFQKKQLRRKAQDVAKTDVENLDSGVDTSIADHRATDAKVDVTVPVAQADQLQLADRPSDIDDGTETGFSQDNPPDGGAKAFEETNKDFAYEAGITAGKRRMLSALEAYELKEQLGLVERIHKIAEIAKLEGMDPRELKGYKQALVEVQSKSASTTRRVASRGSRFPLMGRETRVSVRDEQEADDALILL